MIGVLPEPIGFALNLVVLVVAFATAEERNRQGGGWWTILALGAVLALLGEGLSHLADTPGSIVALVGGLMVAAAAAIGFPVAD